MAYTKNMKRTGKAASTELAETREHIRQEERRYAKQFQEKYLNALDLLKELSPHGWEEWYDHAPAETLREMYPLIKTRCRELLKAETPEEKENRLKWREYWDSLIDALETLDPHGWEEWYDRTWKEKGCRTKLEMLPYVLEKLVPRNP